MISLNGIYENGVIKLEGKPATAKSAKVIVTFLDEEIDENKSRITSKSFSFAESREKSKRYKGSLANAIIEERNTNR